MKKEIRTRVTAGVLSAVMLCAAVPVTTAFSGSSAGIVSAAEDDSTTEIYSSGFEDGDVSAFTGRGGVETITATDSQGGNNTENSSTSETTTGNTITVMEDVKKKDVQGRWYRRQ